MKALLLIGLVACSSGDAEVASDTPLVPTKDAIVKTTDTGPVKTTLTVWPAKPSLSDAIYARLEVTAPAGVTIDAPFQQAGDQKLGRFDVVGFTRDDHPGVTQQTYTLNAPSSGRHRIPPLRLEMLDARAGSKKTEILTEEVALEIAPIKTEQVDAQLHPAAGELPITVGGLSWLAILGLLSGVAIAGSGSVLAYRAWKAKRRIAKQRSAYDEAVARLRELEHKGAPESAEADRWFVELSAIVRQYLEDRYEIRAPELTTEEFLQTVARGGALTGAHEVLLAGFLERCDRVKFAGYRPDETESLVTLKSARGFIEDTRLAEVAS